MLIKLIYFIIILPLWILLLLTIIHPEEMLMSGSRWQFDNDVKVSKLAINITRIIATMFFIVLSIALILNFIK